MPKITAKELQKELKALTGVDVEIVEDENEVDFDRNSFYQAIDNQRRVVLEPAIAEKVKKEVSGIAGRRLRKYLEEHTGISKKTLEEIEDDAEAIAAAVKFNNEKWDGSAKEMNKKLEEIARQKDKEREEALLPLQQEVEKWQRAYKGRDIVAKIQKELGKIKIPDGADRGYLAKKAYEEAMSLYDLDVDEADPEKVNVLQKGTKFAATNKQGNNPFDWQEFLTGFVRPIYGNALDDNRDVDTRTALEAAKQKYNAAAQGKAYTPANNNKKPQSLEDLNRIRAEKMQKVIEQQGG